MKKTNINWTEYTWNPWWGCKKVSKGCKFCYIDNIMERAEKNPKKLYQTGKATREKPLKLKEPTIIFTCSMSDFFIEGADEWRKEAWGIIKRTPQHIYQILTKRPERILENLPDDWGEGYENVWLGVSVEDNEVIHRIETLKKVPAVVRFISFEPLLGDVEVNTDILEGIHWGIIGGESGGFKNGKPQYRPTEPKWIMNLIARLKKANVDIWFKQTGTYLAKKYSLSGKGENLSELPESLHYRGRPDLSDDEELDLAS